MQALKSAIPDVPTRLLIPISTQKSTSTIHPFASKHSSTTRLGRPRSDSAAPSISTQSNDDHRFFDFPSAFDLIQDHIQLSGYQIYAVEKWLVEKSRANVLLVVYTGDPNDKITVSILAPSASLLPEDARKEWEQAIHHLRRDGARPHETDKGVIMITSLANFRSDYTVVHIPDGNFPAHREQLYVNINLMRMGCSGRSALTLQEPSDTTKERFVTMYQFSDTIRPSEEFRKTVLQLIRIIQSALSLFELFPIDPAEHNGLLCDQTVDGFQKWIVETGVPYVFLEPTERAADPSAVAALLSLITAMRNKLSSLLPSVPKDPFLQSRRFVRALAQFVNQRINVNSKSPSPASAICHHAYFNLKLIKDVDRAFEKYRSSDAYRLHRVVFNKLDDFTSATTNAMTSSAKGLRHGKSLSLTMSSKDVEGLLECTTDLAIFVNKIISARAKDCAQSLRYLWSGRLEALERKRIETVWSDAEEEREKEREREKSESEDDGDALGGVRPWSNRVQRKIENWAGREFGRTRLKKQSPDLFTSPINERSPEEQVTPASTGSVPRVVVSGDPDEPLSGLSSGQASPISPSASMYALGNFPSAHGSALLANEDGLQRRLSNFNRSAVADTQGPSAKPRRRTFSWADPVSANALEIEQDWDLELAQRLSSPGASVGPASAGRMTPSPAVSRRSSYARGRRRQRAFLLRRKRSLSFDDRIFLDESDVLSPEHMQIDVDLCAQCWALSCRKYYITATIAILQALSQATSASNETLRRHNEEYAARVAQVLLDCELVADVERALVDADSTLAETQALKYETDSLDVASLWRMARAPRMRVFAIRDRVFGVRSAGGRRRGALALAAAAAASSGSVAGVDGLGHGRFNRVQRRLNGDARLVDYLGRTESEVEEEAELPEDVLMGEGDSENEDGDEEWRDALDTASPGKDEDGRGHGTGQLQALSGWLLELFTTWGKVLGVGRGREVATSDIGGGSVRGDDGEDTTEEEGAESTGRTRQVGVGMKSGSDAGLELEGLRNHGRGHGHANGHAPRHRLSTVGEEDEDISVSSVTSA